MSIVQTEAAKCDVCGDTDVLNQRHYLITVKEFSTINGDYFRQQILHVCTKHDLSKVQLSA